MDSGLGLRVFDRNIGDISAYTHKDRKEFRRKVLLGCRLWSFRAWGFGLRVSEFWRVGWSLRARCSQIAGA